MHSEIDACPARPVSLVLAEKSLVRVVVCPGLLPRFHHTCRISRGYRKTGPGGGGDRDKAHPFGHRDRRISMNADQKREPAATVSPGVFEMSVDGVDVVIYPTGHIVQ